jgi:hypothetical protein
MFEKGKISFFSPFKKIDNVDNKNIQLDRSEKLLRVMEDWEFVKNNTTIIDFDHSNKILSEKLGKLTLMHKPKIVKKFKVKDVKKTGYKSFSQTYLQGKSQNEKRNVPETQPNFLNSKETIVKDETTKKNARSLSLNFHENLSRLSERHKNSISNMITNKIDEAVQTRKKFIRVKKELFPSISKSSTKTEQPQQILEQNKSNLYNWIVNNKFMKYMRTFYNAKSNAELLNSLAKMCKDVYNIKPPIDMKSFQEMMEAEKQFKEIKMKPYKSSPYLKKSLLKDFEKRKELKEDELNKKIEEIKRMFKLDDERELDELSEEKDEEEEAEEAEKNDSLVRSHTQQKYDNFFRTQNTYSFKKTWNSFSTNFTKTNFNKKLNLTTKKFTPQPSINPQFFENCNNNFRSTKSLFITNTKIVDKGNEAINTAYVKTFAPSQQRIYQDPVILSLAQDTMIDFRKKGGFIYGNSKGFYLKTNDLNT